MHGQSFFNALPVQIFSEILSICYRRTIENRLKYDSKPRKSLAGDYFTSENMNFDGGGRGVARKACVNSRVSGVGALHQQVDRRLLSLLSDNLKEKIFKGN